jgi:hypothetical protein
MACSACKKQVEAIPPNQRYWVLIVAFWAFSLAAGIGVAAGVEWAGMLVVAWCFLAMMAGVLVDHATGFTCSECGVPVAPSDGEEIIDLPTPVHA